MMTEEDAVGSTYKTIKIAPEWSWQPVYIESVRLYACPLCFSTVVHWDLEKHKAWHLTLDKVLALAVE